MYLYRVECWSSVAEVKVDIWHEATDPRNHRPLFPGKVSKRKGP